MSRITPFVYLAYPIDFAPGAARGMASAMTDALAEGGLAAYVPGFAFKLPFGATPTPVISSVNRHALTQCEGLVAFLPPEGGISFGVPMEIGQALTEGKPVCIVGDEATLRRSWALRSDSELVFYSNQFGSQEARKLSQMINHQRRWRDRPPASQAMFVKAEQGAQMPTRTYEGDAGFDLYTLGDHLLEPGEFIDVPCGVSVQLPDDIWAMITGRSSTLRKLDLLVTTGIIDSGYRGPLYAGVRNMGPGVVEVKNGQRIAQLIPFPLTSARLHPVRVDVLNESDRGESGFGSSGA